MAIKLAQCGANVTVLARNMVRICTELNCCLATQSEQIKAGSQGFSGYFSGPFLKFGGNLSCEVSFGFYKWTRDQNAPVNVKL